MPDPIVPTVVATPADDSAELVTLRRVNTELLTKSATRKTRITELEATVTELQGKLSESADTIHDVTVGGPLKAMAESISIAPELWLDQLTKSYKVESRKGVLTLLATDGTPVMKGDKPVAFERNALVDLLTDAAHPQAKLFGSITIASRASGAGSIPGVRATRATTETAPSPPQFGLR
jgi:Mg-chelatase subunit ChlD